MSCSIIEIKFYNNFITITAPRAQPTQLIKTNIKYKHECKNESTGKYGFQRL